MRTLLALGLCALAACGGPDDSRPAASSPPPAVELLDLAGLEARTVKRDGRPLLLNFWAMW